MKIRHRLETPQADQSALGLPPLEEHALQDYGWLHVLKTAAILFAVVGAIYLVLNQLMPTHFVTREVNLALNSPALWWFIGAGVLAQTVDGALGMAYGVTANSLLMANGVPPAAATAAVHLSEVFTTGFSGFSHYRLGNFNRGLFLRLLVPGLIGAVAGAYLVSQIDGKLLKPWVSGYLLIMGVFILFKAWRSYQQKTAKLLPKEVTAAKVAPLALLGGFVDSVGGGGWGPVVTTTLLGNGHAPKATIGSVNAAEFFLTIASATAFAFLIGFGYWTAIVGLVLGGLFAAPFAAWLTHRMKAQQLLVLVGLLITGLSIYNLSKAFA